MVTAAAFFRVDDSSLFFVVAVVIFVAGIIAYVGDLRARRKPQNEEEHPRRAA